MSEVKAAAMDSVWDGGVSPYGVNSKKFGMWLFIISDALTFSALLVTYTYLRLATPNWPLPFHFSPSIVFSTVMTAFLLTSSLTMVMAVHSMARGDRKKTVLWLLATMFCGATFCGLHLTEWRHLMVEEKVTPLSNPWGEPLFGATFFGITGLHMTHVAIGVIYLGIIAFAVSRGKFKHEDVEVSGLYWHFVDLVWMFVFPLVYLMSVKG
ncbi:MAG: cytochrome c oxidase subunit 3 [Acidobacteria bacterium]|nr:cytochrome c oxidase subunit 3 [Acidobacteriota bacterium]MBI3470479.1 cytochrome c oxidase subunit 3 [Candidatus Solibacter usitatus]